MKKVGFLVILYAFLIVSVNAGSLNTQLFKTVDLTHPYENNVYGTVSGGCKLTIVLSITDLTSLGIVGYEVSFTGLTTQPSFSIRELNGNINVIEFSLPNVPGGENNITIKADTTGGLGQYEIYQFSYYCEILPQGPFLVNSVGFDFADGYLFQTGAGYVSIPLNITKRLPPTNQLSLQVNDVTYACNVKLINNTCYIACYLNIGQLLGVNPNVVINGYVAGSNRFSVILESFVKVQNTESLLPQVTYYPSTISELPSKTNFYQLSTVNNFLGYFIVIPSSITNGYSSYIVGGSPGNLTLLSSSTMNSIQTLTSQLVLFKDYAPTSPVYVQSTNQFKCLTNYVQPQTTFVSHSIQDNYTLYNTVSIQGTVNSPWNGLLEFTQNGFSSIYPNYYPFGCVNGLPSAPTKSMGYPFIIPSSYKIDLYLDGSSVYSNNAVINDIQNPKLLDIQYKYINSREMVVTAVASDDVSGIKTIYLYSQTEAQYRFYELNSWDLVSGTLKSGTFQKLIQYKFDRVLGDLMIRVEDHSGKYSKYEYLNGKPLPQYLYDFTTYKYQIRSDISNIFFKDGNVMDLSTSAKNNTMIIRFLSPKPDVSAVLYFTDENLIYNRYFIGDWNEELQQMEIDFYLPSRLLTGSVFYSISYPGYIFDSPYLNQRYLGSYLKVISDNCDRMPPLITSIIEFNSDGYFGFDITIEDETGFDRGFISVKSSIDDYRFNFTLSSEAKNPLVDVYRISIPFVVPCVFQRFSLDIVELYDINEAVSTFSDGNSNGVSPFMKILGNVNTTIPSCGLFTDNLPPSFGNITSITSSVDTGSEDRLVTVSFMVYDDVAIYYPHLPSCLATSEGMVYLTVVSTLVNFTQNVANYRCDFNLPYGFGYPSESGKLLISIYGIADTSLKIIGTDITDFVNITFTKLPFITKTSNMTTLGGSLTIYGRNFGLDPLKTTVEVSYKDLKFNYTTSTLYTDLVVIDSILEKQSSFNITLINTGQRSNIFTVLAEYLPPTGTPNPTSSGSKCPGTPECGGSSNGICVNAVCQCKSPWIGSDCLSQVIVVPNPTINTTDPAIDNNFNTTLPDGDTVTLKTLISIISLNEMNINNTLIKEHPFTTWIFTNQTTVNQTLSQQYQYSTNITNNRLTTNIIITLQYFTEETTLIFANQLLTILPSSIKYNIKLTPYQFSSELNYLQLIMSASIESTSTDSCTYQETGTTNDSNNDYVKLQIDNNSLYGRFIKRGVIDNRVRTIENIFFNNNESTNSNSNSRIGINIPYFRKSVELDPDFSVLLDITNANDKDNSICHISDKGLTKSQLAGIIIGAVAFVSIVAISIAYVIWKKKKHQKLLGIMNKKLGSLNTNK
ncbi:hypothetical protein DLAC_07300 [Tieghemostelium lacteum]|uniref:EGF-like domain-containing protein n=1 Tax=Tieghemostelium lacteum TaxID=361077 RepID=A0A151ZC71_TIELA|nr:hypothetical protein DLAC_07300 [Tieghemostelium lacteum]|eukprot:KYQ91538.1 hypothetical protein DLAC_07300 [Tieghemostelium lacteum]